MSRITMKKIIIVAIFTLFSWPYMTSLAEIELPEIGDSAGSIVSPYQEYRIGQSFYWRLQQSVDLIDDPEITDYLSELGERLVANSDAPQLSFKFFMVPDNRVNAFAAPGGFIGVNSGLLLTSHEEDELASVLAHEIAHVTQRHLIRSFERQKQLSLPTTAAMIGALLLGAADPEMGAAAITAVQAGGVQAQLNFTRANEREADNMGMLTLVRSGFNAHAMPTFFERLQQANQFHTGRSIPEFLRSHPVTSSRIADSRGRANTYPLKRQPSDRQKFYLIREKLRVMTTPNLTQLIQYYAGSLEVGSNVNSTATKYGYSLALAAIGNYSQAKAILRELIDNDGERLTYQLALADMELSRGHIKTALAIYEQNQRLYPRDYALTIKQVIALLQAKQPEVSTEKLLNQYQLGRQTQKVYKLLAQAYGDMDNNSQAHSWLAEYYYSAGRLKQSVDQLKLAIKFARGDKFQLAKLNSRLHEVETQLKELDEPL